MELMWWFVAIVLMAVGLLGTIVPAVPGTTIILAAAILHRVMVGGDRSISWWSIAVLVLLTLASYALDAAASYFGAKRFGASKWGMIGAVLGAVVGLFFGFIGIFIGPVVGALAGEIISGKKLLKAGRAGWGSLLGSLFGMVGKMTIALVMISWFLIAAPSPL